MNIDEQEALQRLVEEIDLFMEVIDLDDANDDGEYTFLEDESGISNTDVDNLVESLYSVKELAERFST